MSVTRRGLLWFLAWCSSEFQIQLRSQAVVRSSQRIQLRSHVNSPGGGCSPPSPPPGSANGLVPLLNLRTVLISLLTKKDIH